MLSSLYISLSEEICSDIQLLPVYRSCVESILILAQAAIFVWEKVNMTVFHSIQVEILCHDL